MTVTAFPVRCSRHHRCEIRASTGLTLLELLFATVVLAIAIGPLFMSLTTANKESSRLVEETIATNLASTMIEKLSSISYQALPVTTPPVSDVALYGQLQLLGLPDFPPTDSCPAGFTRSVAITRVSSRTVDPNDPSNGPTGDLTMIQVWVTWNPAYLQGKVPRTISLATLVTSDRDVPP